MKITVFALFILLTLSAFSFASYATTGQVHNVATSEEFAEALLTAENGDTIRLVADITHSDFMVLDTGLIIDINGHTLNIFTNIENRAAVAARSYGELIFTGDGELNITSENGIGLSAATNGKITIGGKNSNLTTTITGERGLTALSHASITLNGNIISTDGGPAMNVQNHAQVTVYGNVSGWGIVVQALTAATVHIHGSVSGNEYQPYHTIVMARDEDTFITVGGNVYGGRGVHARYGAEIVVHGDIITNTGNAVRASDASRVTVYGRLDSHITAIVADGNSIVYAYGSVRARIAGRAIEARGQETFVTLRDHAPGGVLAVYGATIVVYGNVSASTNAVSIRDSGQVYIGGNVIGNILVNGGYGNIVVNGNVSGNVRAEHFLSVTYKPIYVTLSANIIHGDIRARNATITVYANVSNTNWGSVRATHGATVKIIGDILATNHLYVNSWIIVASYENSNITIIGNVYGIIENTVRTEHGATVTIYGNMTGRTSGEGITVQPNLQLPTTVHLYLYSYYILNSVNNSILQTMDVLPILQNYRTLVPARFISYVFGAEVGWCPYSYKVTLTLGGHSLAFAIGEILPGMDVPAQLIGGRTFVPLRFISEFFGAEVDWCPDEERIEISVPYM